MIDNFIPEYDPGDQHSQQDKNLWFIFRKAQVLVRTVDSSATIPAFTGSQVSSLAIEQYAPVGSYNGTLCYAAEVTEDKSSAIPGHEFKLLRELYGVLHDDLFFIAGYAFDVIHWHISHQFCGKCGTQTEAKPTERAKVCPSCGQTSYPRISPAIIVAVVKDNKLLMGRSSHFKPKFYSVLAGYLDLGESLEECVKREVKEESNIEVENVRYFSSQPWPFSHSLMVGFIADYKSGEIKVDNIEVLEARWFSKEELPKMPGRISIARALIDWFIENH